MILTEPRFSVMTISADHAQLGDLLAQSDAYFAALYPSDSNHLESLEALTAARAAVFGIEQNGQLIACGAVKIMSDDGNYGEIKRVFVRDAWRKHGCAASIMEKLHEYLRSENIVLARLETGRHEPDTLRFYQKLGYQLRPPFGKYHADPYSVFMEKSLEPLAMTAHLRRNIGK
ncbi:MAG: GNAT family N-acetyltransferase [Alphaproteobacteria bacterium]|nr:GNAT family N-acetyltransferase [Alphaproteobacteria bacterium]